MKKILFSVPGILLLLASYSQQKPADRFTISGTIKSRSKGETLIGASIRAGNTGTASNEYGFYSLTLDKGSYTLEFSAIGLQSKSEQVPLTGTSG
jgi:hypothetical protein